MFEKILNAVISEEGLASLIKIISASLGIGAVKLIILIQDKKLTNANVALSMIISIILSAAICYPLRDVLGAFWGFIVNSCLTLFGENIIRALIYKKDWDKIIDSIFETMVNWFNKPK